MRRCIIVALCIISVFVCFCLCSFTVSAAVVEGGGGGTSSGSNGYLYLTEYKYTDTLTSFTAVGSTPTGPVNLSYTKGPSNNADKKDSLDYFQWYLGGTAALYTRVTIDVPELASPIGGLLTQKVSVVVGPGSSETWSSVSITGVYSDGTEVVGTSSDYTISNVNGDLYLLQFSYTASADTQLDSIVIDWYYEPYTGQAFPWFGISTIVIENYADSKENAPIYKAPDDSGFNDYQNAEDKLDGTVDDTVDGYRNSFDDAADILVSDDGLFRSFQLIKVWLEGLLEISFIYDLVMVALTFGVMVFLINLGGMVIRHHKNRGD